MRASFVTLAIAWLPLLVSCASSGTVTDDVRSQLAPAGTLRVGVNLGNVLLTTKDPAGGDPRGIVPDIAHELGRRLGVPVKLISYPGPAQLSGSIASNDWDIAFFAVEPRRAGQVDFSPPYVEIETTYLVLKDSRFHDASEVDQDGVIIAVAKGAGYESILVRDLKRAKLLRTTGLKESLMHLSEGKAQAIAGLRPPYMAYADSTPTVRVVDGRFAVVQQAIGLQKGRAAAAQYLNDFIADLKQSGFIAKTIADNHVRGLTVAR